MAKTLILFNLKPGISVQDYEEWARDLEIPTVNSLQSVEKFEAFKTAGLMFSDGKSPYAYAEILDIKDADAFGEEIAIGKMENVALTFNRMTQDPVFINLEILK